MTVWHIYDGRIQVVLKGSPTSVTFGDYKLTSHPSLIPHVQPPLPSSPSSSTTTTTRNCAHSHIQSKNIFIVSPLFLLCFSSVSMATIVCQGLQSCLESQLVESRTLRLKLSSPKTHFPQPIELALKPFFIDYNTKEVGQKCQASSPDYGGWNFIQPLSDTSKSSNEEPEVEKPYSPPQIKRTLCDKSLELCTENLGSETGSEDCIFSMSSSDSKAGYSPTREQKKPRQVRSSRKGNSQSFPPPLTTMSGSESIQLRPRREDGRLIIEAIKSPSTYNYFQVDRSHGRLRLTLFKDSSRSSSSFDFLNDADNEEIEEEFENDKNNELVAEEGGVEEEKEEMDGNRINVGDEMGSEKINQRPSRCKEGEEEKKNGLLNWEPPCWVATS
ncbi:hypothetical protein HS088_TW01G00208 [Tripterygium wilfordii]|uniref:FAF domain-containing protein n=1 Tax=Tripterygium wilfordii TaxID=458696 RepID=A0A7J7E0X9_TRIWF|nr:protein FANTASTIC FOUR 3-like [Tripterygium wilfordii]KAF5752300.1 hypothetical protein HS088_TW01G00208 [Tripterygium wilfordii]